VGASRLALAVGAEGLVGFGDEDADEAVEFVAVVGVGGGEEAVDGVGEMRRR